MRENDFTDHSFSEDTSGKLNASGSLGGRLVGILFLGLVLALPSGIMGIFDGLPWTGKAETLTLSAIIPLLLILGWRFLLLRFPVAFLCVLLILKIILFFGSPSSGWLVKIHPNMSQGPSASFIPFKIVEGDSWVETYATSWNKNASGILQKPWADKKNFPLDWMLTVYGICSISGADCFDKINPLIELEGALVVPEGKTFALVAQGVKEGTLIATNESGDNFILSPAISFKDAGQQGYQLPPGKKWRVSGKLRYLGPDWSLIPVLIESNGTVTSELGRSVLWQNEKELLESEEYIGFYKTLSFIVDGGVIIFLLAWTVWTVVSLIKTQFLNWPLALFSLSLVFLPTIMAPVYSALLNIVGLVDRTTVSYLGFSIAVISICYLLLTRWKKDYLHFKADSIFPSIFLIFAPGVLFFFSRKWWSTLEQWTVWGSGDDWTSYQSFARKIVVEGEWLEAGEGVIVMMPLYRYFVGIYHWLFGQSAFVQHMADVWCILAATAFLAHLAMKFRISNFIVFAGTIIYLMTNFIAAFRYHIGRGLVEQHAMICMMLAGWFLYRARKGGTGHIMLATLFGILGYWSRQDHLIAIAGMVLLAFEPIEGPTGGWKGYWDRIKLRWGHLTIYWGGGILSVLAMCFRNWWLGGDFFPAGSFAITSATGVYPLPEYSFYTILMGNTWHYFPTIPSIFLVSGTFIALTALAWRPKLLKNYPLSFGTTIVGIFLPYAFIWYGAYPPRFSIHLLPFALLSVMYLLDTYWKEKHKPSEEES